jgi:hypothetical protein
MKRLLMPYAIVISCIITAQSANAACPMRPKNDRLSEAVDVAVSAKDDAKRSVVLRAVIAGSNCNSYTVLFGYNDPSMRKTWIGRTELVHSDDDHWWVIFPADNPNGGDAVEVK